MQEINQNYLKIKKELKRGPWTPVFIMCLYFGKSELIDFLLSINSNIYFFLGSAANKTNK